MQYEPPSGVRVDAADDEEFDEMGKARVEYAQATVWVAHHHRNLLGVVVCLLLVGVVLFGALYFGLRGDLNGHVHEHAANMQQTQSIQQPDALYSVSGAGMRNTEYRKNFCHSALYYTVAGGNASTLEKAPTDRPDYLNSLRPYVVQARLHMRLNVDPQSDMGCAAATNYPKNTRPDGRCMVAHLEMGSSYGAFSTLRLVESALDIYRRTVRTTRAITLCSDDPVSGAGRCKYYTTIDGTLILNSTYTVLMDLPAVLSPPAARKNRTTGGGDSADTVKVDYERTERHVMEDEIAHIRLYHILGYSEYAQQADDASETGDYNGDYQVLSAQLAHC